MTYTELIEHFGSEIKAAAALGFSQTAIKNWSDLPVIPRLSQLAIQTITENKLLADENIK